MAIFGQCTWINWESPMELNLNWYLDGIRANGCYDYNINNLQYLSSQIANEHSIADYYPRVIPYILQIVVQHVLRGLEND